MASTATSNDVAPLGSSIVDPWKRTSMHHRDTGSGSCDKTGFVRAEFDIVWHLDVVVLKIVAIKIGVGIGAGAAIAVVGQEKTFVVVETIVVVVAVEVVAVVVRVVVFVAEVTSAYVVSMDHLNCLLLQTPIGSIEESYHRPNRDIIMAVHCCWCW